MDEGLIPSMGVGEVHELAVSIDDWQVKEVDDDGMEYLITDDDSWSVTRGVLRRDDTLGPDDGLLRVENRGQGFLLHGTTSDPPPPARPVLIKGFVSVEPIRMPVFGFPDPRARAKRRPWRVLVLHCEIVPRGGAGGRKPAQAIDRLLDPVDVDTGSYYSADLRPLRAATAHRVSRSFTGARSNGLWGSAWYQ